MINEIPKISITQDFAIDDPDDEMDDNECTSNMKEVHTDVEELDSDGGTIARARKRGPNTLKIRIKPKTSDISDAGTDVEDLDDSQSEDDGLYHQPDDIEISLTEFLDQGFVDETASFDGKHKLNQSKRNKRASLLGVTANDGGITDCEDLTDEDDAVDIVDLDDPANQHYNNILMQCDDFNTVSVQGATIANTNPNQRQQWRASTSSRAMRVQQSDSDGEQPSSWNALSDVENMAVSDDDDDCREPFYSKMKHSKSALDAEEMVMMASDTEEPNSDCRKASCPAIDIGFRYTGDAHRCGLRQRKPCVVKKSPNALLVDATPDELLTDVENLDSSDDDSNNIRSKLAIPAAYVLSKSAPLTDVEDFDVDDECLTSCSKDIKLPSPVREIKLITEDDQGDPIAKVMPLAASASGTFLGVTEPYIDKGLTDTEDMSGNEEEYRSDLVYEVIELPTYDGGIVSCADGITSFARNRKVCGTGDVEPVTDVEEVAVHGAAKQLRRKRSKPKSKCRPFLNVDGNSEAVLTDTEELYVSDDQAGRFNHLRQNLATLQLSGGGGGNPDGGKTDTEDLTDDEGLLAKNTVTDIDPNIFRQDAFFSTITSSECANAANRHKEGYSKISTVIKTKEASQPSSELSLTDIEDMNVQSDGDDMMLTIDNDTYSRAQTVTPMELRSAFNEGANFSVHDRANSSFDPNNEANHIKGYRDIQDNHTDVEFLDEDTLKTCTVISFYSFYVYIFRIYIAFNCFSIFPS